MHKKEMISVLIRFNVKNFLSFDKRDDNKSEEFSMIAGKVRNKPEHIYDNKEIKLLKFAAVYGANASGKSNLVRTIDFARKTILTGLPDGHTRMYCKNKSENKSKESYFEFELKIDNKYYSYGFEVVLSESRFVSEWLVELSKDSDNERVIFERDIVNNRIDFDESIRLLEDYKKIDVYADDICADDSILFLNEINRNKRILSKKADMFRKVFLWFEECLEVHLPMQPISDYSYMAQKNDININQICEMISAFGTGITSYKMGQSNIEEVFKRIPPDMKNVVKQDIEKIQAKIEKEKSTKKASEETDNNIRFVLGMRSERDFFLIKIMENGQILCETLKFIHGNKDILFDLYEESDGTIRILDLLEILLRNKKGKVYVIDELDRCLHPSLTYKYVELFLEVAKKMDIQLVVTTHESRLMDFDLLRRDEIWFVNKDNSGKTDIYSLEEYNERFDKKIDKAYLEGRYGGVPVFNTVFPLKEV